MTDKGKSSGHMTKKAPDTDKPGKHGLRPDEQREQADSAAADKKADDK